MFFKDAIMVKAAAILRALGWASLCKKDQCMPKLENTQKTYGPFSYYAKPAKVAASAMPGGSVTIEHLVAGDMGTPSAIWNVIHSLNAGESIELLISNGSFRLTPVGGAQFSFVGE